MSSLPLILSSFPTTHDTFPTPCLPSTVISATTAANLNPRSASASFSSSPSSSSSHSDSFTSALDYCLRALSPHATSQLHACLLRHGLLFQDTYLSSQLVQLYAACGQLDHGRTVLHLTPRRLLTPFFYNVLIRAYTDAGLHDTAVCLFLEMLESGLCANEFTFPFVLKSCSATGLLSLAEQIHSWLVKTGLLFSNVFSATALLDVYAKWGELESACELFDKIPERNSVAWNSVISCYAQNGFYEDALEMLGMVGQELRVKDRASSWNSVIAGCVRRGDPETALEMFGVMVASMQQPNAATFNTLLPIIPQITSLSSLKELHAYVMRHLEPISMDHVNEDRLQSAMASGYASNGRMDYALRMFADVKLRTCFLWNSMISGFFNAGNRTEALDLFCAMANEYGKDRRTLSKVSLTLLLSECSAQSRSGAEIHAYAYKNGLETYPSVTNALISMYTRRGDFTTSERVFQMAVEKDTITWNTMVWSYVLGLEHGRAFDLFQEMLSQGLTPDEFSYGSVLDACANSSSLLLGMALHCHVLKHGFSPLNTVLKNSIMDMYGKCGCPDAARKVFEEIEFKDIISWNTIISCYAYHGRPHEAFSLFNDMKDDGLTPNRVTFTAMLSACSHAGLVDEALQYFASMRENGVVPDVDHYTCIVDNLSRSGQLDRAYELIKSMPIEPDDCIWGALLGGCRIHGNVELAELAGEQLIRLQPSHSGYRVLLANVYADVYQWDNVAQVRQAMKNERVKKSPGWSWIDLGGETHRFLTADKTHKQCVEVYDALLGLTNQLRDEGYAPLSNIPK